MISKTSVMLPTNQAIHYYFITVEDWTQTPFPDLSMAVNNEVKSPITSSINSSSSSSGPTSNRRDPAIANQVNDFKLPFSKSGADIFIPRAALTDL